MQARQILTLQPFGYNTKLATSKFYVPFCIFKLYIYSLMRNCFVSGLDTFRTKTRHKGGKAPLTYYTTLFVLHDCSLN